MDDTVEETSQISEFEPIDEFLKSTGKYEESISVKSRYLDKVVVREKPEPKSSNQLDDRLTTRREQDWNETYQNLVDDPEESEEKYRKLYHFANDFGEYNLFEVN